MIWNWLESIEQGAFRIELCPLRLFNDDGTYQGQGVLSWDCDAGVHVEAFTDGGDTLIHRLIAGTAPCKYGELLPDSYYLQFQGNTRDDWEVQIERITPDHFHVHSGHPTVVWQIPDTGILSQIELTAENRTNICASTLALAGPVDLDYWPRASKTTYDNPRFREERHTLDWLEYEIPAAKITVQQRPNSLVRVVVDRKQPDYATVLNAFRSALGFVTGRKVNVVAVESYDSKFVTRYLKWPSSPVRSRRFSTPLGPEMHGTSPELLLSKATAFFADERNSYVANMLHACLDSTDNTFTTHSMVIGAAVEGLVKWSSHKPEKKKKEISNVLKDWADRKVLNVEDSDERAWRQLRNPSAHGELLLQAKTDALPHILALTRAQNLVVKLVLQLIDYDGPYFDHVAGKPLEFPKANPGDL